MNKKGVRASKIQNILGIYSNKIYHRIHRNIGYTQVGLTLNTKVKIANASAKNKGI
jgi:hypothetical protein